MSNGPRAKRARAKSQEIQIQIQKGGVRRKTPIRTTSFGPADVFVGFICARTRHKRSLVASGFG
jgi:hypothetical protein